MMIKSKIVLSIIFFLVLNQSFAQLNIPRSRSYNQTVYQLFLSDSLSDINSSHISFKPIHESRSNIEKVFKDEGQYYYWITQKLFKEHFLVFEGEDFWCVVDPVVDLEIGKDFSAENQAYRFWNTRGVRIQAKFFENFGFETSIYETQATLLDYQVKYVESHGEYTVSGNKYNQQDAIIPGYARTKPFNTDGFDFAFARGYFNYQATEWLNIEAGNGNHFIGHGHRSLLLSDFTVNYPYIKPEFLLFNKKLQYNIIYASHQNLYRLPFHLTPEANYEKKMGVSHYLEYSFNKNFQVGIFENNMWVTTDSLGTKPFNFLALNPILGNSAFGGGNTPDRYNGFFGLNAAYNFSKTMLYGQVIFDDKTVGGFQFGINQFDLFTPKLNIQLEYNQVFENTYTSVNKRSNYTHSNLALAHPLGNNFQEILLIADYSFNRVFFNYTAIYSKRIPSDSTIQHQTLLSPKNIDNSTLQGAVNVWLTKVEFGYRFNKKYNLECYFGFLNRISSTHNEQNRSNFAYFGIKTNLNQKTLDW